MSGSGRETLPNVWEWLETLQDVREWSGVLPGCPGVVGGPTGCLKGLADVREWSGGYPGCPGLVVKPSWMSRRPFWMSGSVRKALPDIREALSNVWEW